MSKLKSAKGGSAIGEKIIGLDVGGTKITGVVFDGKKALRELTIVTPKNLLDFEKSILKLADFLSLGDKSYKIGIGMAGHVNRAAGIIQHSPNIKFVKNLQLVKFFKLNGYKTVALDNDAKCFVRAEGVLGSVKNSSTIVGITLGTGIGGGLMSEGKVYYGVNSGAGELGHMMYNSNQTFEDVFKIARDSNNNTNLARIIGALLTNVYRVVDPKAVVLGGGVTKDSKRNFIKQAIAICAKNLSSYNIKPNNVKISKLKNAGALGAALLVM